MQKVIGCDIGNGILVFYDPEEGFKVWIEKGVKVEVPQTAKIITETGEEKKIPVQKFEPPKRYDHDNHLHQLGQIVKGKTVVIENTGTYSVRYGILFLMLGAKEVYTVHGREFARFYIHTRKTKDDYFDAYYLHLYGRQDNAKIHKFNPDMHKARLLYTQYKKLIKARTSFINTLRQILPIYYPHQVPITSEALIKKVEKGEYDNLGISHLIQPLKVIIKEIKQIQKQMEEELDRLTETERRILGDFFNSNIAYAYCVKALYWDISRFHNEDSFISYMILGGNTKSSGKGKRGEWKITNVRGEILVLGYNIYISSFGRGTEKKIFSPLAKYVSRKWRKGKILAFTDIFVRLLYKCLREQKSLSDVLLDLIRRIEKDPNPNNRTRLECYTEMLNIISEKFVAQVLEKLEK
ncbi:MAG: transposase [candidate division WOR-3 bacterium]